MWVNDEWGIGFEIQCSSIIVLVVIDNWVEIETNNYLLLVKKKEKEEEDAGGVLLLINNYK